MYTHIFALISNMPYNQTYKVIRFKKIRFPKYKLISEGEMKQVLKK